MSHRGSKANHEDQWRRSQRRQGYNNGLYGLDMGYADEHYQRGLREGRKARSGLHVVQEGEYAEGKYVIVHVARVGGVIVGEWRKGEPERSWAHDGLTGMRTLAEWRGYVRESRDEIRAFGVSDLGNDARAVRR